MKRILVLVDCQNDFIDGVLGTKEAVAVCVANCGLYSGSFDYNFSAREIVIK